MAHEATETLDAKLERGERLIAVWRELSATELASGGTNNHQNTTLNLGGAGLILGILMGFGGLAIAYGFRADLEVALVKAEARELVMSAERKADLRELSTLKRDVATVQAYTTLHGQKITKMEARDVEHP